MAREKRIQSTVRKTERPAAKRNNRKSKTQSATLAEEIAAASVAIQDSDEKGKLTQQIRRLQVDLAARNTEIKKVIDELNHLHGRIELAEATYNPARRYRIGSAVAGKGSSCTALLMLSDLHLEERVDPEVCMGYRYNLEIAAKRNDRVINTAIEVLQNQRRFFPWKDMVIWLGGDMISGAIHQELEATNFQGPAEAILFAQDMMLADIEKIRTALTPRKVTIVCNMGNHGRTTHRKRFSDGYNHSWEWLAFHNMARLFAKDKAVEFIIAKGSLIEIEIESTPIRFTHGDDIRFDGGVGGVFIPLAKKIANWDRRWKAAKTILGHFHSHFHIDAAVMNGCLIGPNAYSIAGGFAAQRPSQTTAIVDSRRGFVDVTQIFAE
jgi:hypothetical protein